MLDTVKMLLGKTGTTEEDHLLQFLIEDASVAVLDYCNLPELPAALVNTVCKMAAAVYRDGDYGQAAPEAPVSSIKEGDVSVSYAVTPKRPAADIYADYHGQLNIYRKLR